MIVIIALIAGLLPSYQPSRWHSSGDGRRQSK